MKLRITVEGVGYDVDVEVLDDNGAGTGGAAAPASRPAASAPAAPMAAPAPRAAAAPVGPSDKVVKAPIAGTVVAIKVQAGQAVTKNQVLLTMEAMKMETNISSPADGRIKAIRATAGQAVKSGEPLVEFE